ncbi:MAG: hypothetical protein AB7G48_05980 [Nitrospiraceae bacterium]
MPTRWMQLYGGLPGLSGPVRLWAVILAVLLWGTPGFSPAVDFETTQQKEERLKQQTHADLFRQWSFDTDPPGRAPAGFAVHAKDGEEPAQWAVQSGKDALSLPNVLTVTDGCNGQCLHLLVAEGLIYEYPDVSVRLQKGSPDGGSIGGVVFGWQDSRNFFAALVDLRSLRLEVIKVLDGQESLIGQTQLKVTPAPWHTLRVQRNTIVSQDFFEISFDRKLVLSVRDQAFGLGEVGLVVRGRADIRFDNFHAAPLFSQRPLSDPAAY